jgi:hypothetical protein
MNFWNISGEARLKLMRPLVTMKQVSKRKHPTRDLWIYNYTPKAVGEIAPMDWIAYPGLSEARGLVLDAEGNVVMRSFEKAWGLETTRKIGTVREDQSVDIFPKLGGHLILVRYVDNELVVASIDSFESDVVEKATELLGQGLWLHHVKLDHNYTFIFELLDELVLIGLSMGEKIIHPGPGGDIEEMLMHWSSGRHGTRDVPRWSQAIRSYIHGSQLDGELHGLAEEHPDDEGYVLWFSDGYCATVKRGK